MEVRILDAQVEFVEQPFATPLILSSGQISVLTEAQASVTVDVGGQRATGRGAIYLSDLWAWPDPTMSHSQRDAELRRLCLAIAADLRQACGNQATHPLELGMHLHESVCSRTSSAPPALACAMCASPFDAAVHDAAGIAIGRSAFGFYDYPCEMPLADSCFEGTTACRAIRRILRPPKKQLRAWCIVCKDDTIEQLGPWVQQRGYRCFKVRLQGRNVAADADRTAETFRMVQELGVRDFQLSVDANEGTADAAGVQEFLQILQRQSPQAFAALAYMEQPTGRDILTHRYDWRAIARLKPVILDEGLTHPAMMKEALAQGWSGLAIKTCKGHSFSLLAAAWAKQHGLLVTMQDLTNPGLALIHSALMAAHLDTINDVELNSPQFTPAANQAYLPRLAGLFQPTGGVHRLPAHMPPGLGSML